MEEYAKQRAEEQAILRAAQQVREEKNKEALKLTAEEVVKIQGRVSSIPVVGPDITGHVTNFANNVKIIQELLLAVILDPVNSKTQTAFKHFSVHNGKHCENGSSDAN